MGEPWKTNSNLRLAVRVGVYGLLAVVAWMIVFPYSPRRPRRTRSQCQVQLRDLGNAVQQWALEHKKGPLDTPKWSEIVDRSGYLEKMPVCPKGGIYNLGSAGGKPTCSIEGHD